MTLFFLGNTGPRELRDVRESVERSVAGVRPFELTPQRLVTLPERGPPRVYAVQTDRPPGLMEIQRRLVQRLVRRPGTSADNRFLPHLTLSRVKEGESAERVDSPLAGSPFPVRSIGLIRSVLGPGGARHEVIERFELAG